MYMRDMTHTYVGHDSFVCGTRLYQAIAQAQVTDADMYVYMYTCKYVKKECTLTHAYSSNIHCHVRACMYIFTYVYVYIEYDIH